MAAFHKNSELRTQNQFIEQEINQSTSQLFNINAVHCQEFIKCMCISNLSRRPPNGRYGPLAGSHPIKLIIIYILNLSCWDVSIADVDDEKDNKKSTLSYNI